MSNTKEFFVKHKKKIAVGGGVAILGTAAYFVFIHKDKDGNTLFGKLRKKSGGNGGGKINVGDLSSRPVKKGGSISINTDIIKKACDAIPTLTHDELMARLQYSGAPTTDENLRALLKQKIGC